MNDPKIDEKIDPKVAKDRPQGDMKYGGGNAQEDPKSGNRLIDDPKNEDIESKEDPESEINWCLKARSGKVDNMSLNESRPKNDPIDEPKYKYVDIKGDPKNGNVEPKSGKMNVVVGNCEGGSSSINDPKKDSSIAGDLKMEKERPHYYLNGKRAIPLLFK